VSELTLRKIEQKIYDGGKLSSDEERHLLKRVSDYWDNHPDVMDRFPRWKKYIAWVAGYQVYDYNKVSRKLVEIPLDRSRKLIINKLKPYVRTLLSKLTAEVPIYSVVPNTSDDDDVKAARMASNLVEGIANKVNFDAVLKDLKLWTIICNRAYLHVFWNEEDQGVIDYRQQPKKKQSDSVDTAPVPSEEELAGGMAPQEELGNFEPIFDEGDVNIEAVSPFQCRPDPLYQERSKWRWFLYGDEVDAEWVEEKWGLKSGSLVEKNDTQDGAYDLTLQDEHELVIGSPSRNDDITGRTVVLKEFWTKKIYLFCTEKKVLQYGVNEYGEIPFFDIEDRIVPIDSYEKGFNFNESLLKDAIPVQREYNRQASIMSQALDRASKLKVLTPLGSLLSKKQWVNDYGVFIDYNRNAGEPHQMKMEPFPMEMPAYKADLEREMEGMVSLSPASFGRLPERASHASGTLVSLLLEQDDVILNPLLNLINNVMSKAWSLALRLVQENYAVPRYLKFTGKNGEEDIAPFKGADLRGNTDVQVVSQTGLPRSRALRVEYILKLREAGLLTDDRSTLEMLEFGNAGKIFTDEMVHEKRAYRENSLIEKNPNITVEEVQGWVYPLERHDVHLKIHLLDRLSVKYEKYTPGQKAASEQHIRDTSAALTPPPPSGTSPNEPSIPTGPPAGAPPMPGEMEIPEGMETAPPGMM